MSTGLLIVGQDDFAAGVVRGVAPDVAPGLGLANSINGLYNDDGDVYRRGGTAAYAPAKDAVNRDYTFLWSGFLGGKAAMLVADSAGLYAVDVVSHAYTQVSATGLANPCQGAVIHDTLYLPNGIAWAGAVGANYATGTLAFTTGSTAVVGTGTVFTGNVVPGTIITVAGQQPFIVKTVVDGTHLTIDRPAPSTVSGVAYTASASAAWARPTELDQTAPIRLCAIANRLVVAANNRIAFSGINAPWSFDPTDYHDLPGGVLVVGLSSIHDTLMSFTNFGLWTVQNMAFDLTDAQGNIQQTLSLLTPEVSLWREAGLCEWAGRIVAPCLDRVFIVDAISAPVPISISISPEYVGYVNAGFQPGQAKVFRNHLFLPVLNGTRTDTLQVCRLDRPVRAGQVYYPWSTFEGQALKATAFDVTLTGATPNFIAASSDRSLQSFAHVFDPDAAHAADQDGTAFVFDVESRDFPTGNGQPNHVRKLRLRYTLNSASDVQILAGYSIGTSEQTYDDLRNQSASYDIVKATYADYAHVLIGPGAASGFPPSEDDPTRLWVALGHVTPQDTGLSPVSWPFPQAKRVRYIRFRFRTVDPVAKLVLHHLDFHVRAATHNR